MMLPASLLVLGAAFSPLRAPGRPALSSPRASPTPTMRYHEKEMVFSAISDEQYCIEQVRLVAREVCKWNGDDWALYDAPKMRLNYLSWESERLGGVVIEYAGWGGQGQDGTLTVQMAAKTDLLGRSEKRLLWSISGARREKAEDMLFKLVLDEIRRGSLKDVCRLAFPQLYPSSWEASHVALQIENRYLRRQVEELQQAAAAQLPPAHQPAALPPAANGFNGAVLPSAAPSFPAPIPPVS